MPIRSRGRPRKYPKKQNEDFEETKYYNFFSQDGRKTEDGKFFDILPIIQEVYNFIYEAYRANKLFSKPKSLNDIPVLLNLVSRNNNLIESKNEKTCDDIFSEYLILFMNKTNKKYFSFMLKFILLFRECYNLSKNKEKKEEEKKVVTNSLPPEDLPNLANEFYIKFVEPNDFFGINENDEKNEIVEIIQHFCIWLFKKGYTTLKLSLAS